MQTQTIASPPALPAGHLIDTFARRRIDYRVYRLAKKFKLKAQDRRDLRQDFLMTLVRAGQSYQPGRCQRSTFIWAVLDRRYKHHVRQLSMQDSHDALDPICFDDVEPDMEYELLDPHGEKDFELVDLQADTQTILQRMPEDLRHICELLMTHTPAEVARRLEVHPSTITRAMQRIRPLFAQAGYGRAG